MRRTLLPSALAAAALLLASSAWALPGLDAGARGIYWFPKISGDVQTVNGVAGDRLDVKNDLGIKDENAPGGEAFLRLGRVHFRAGYLPLSLDGSNVISRNVVFNGKTFGGSTLVSSKIDLKTFDGELQFDLLRPDLIAASFNIGLVAKVKYVDGEVAIASADNTASKDFKAPIPMGGIAAGVGVLKNMIRLDAKGTGIAFSGNHLYEGDVYASFAPFPFVRLQGGYRIIDLKVDESGILAEIRLKGPYVAAQVAF